MSNRGQRKQSESGSPLLDVRGLRVYLGQGARPVDGVSFDIKAGEIVALVGESGSGKSLTALALTRLIPQPPARYAGGTVSYLGQDLLSLPARALLGIRGREVAYIFQEPGLALNPVLRVGDQIAESLRLHGQGGNYRARIIDLLGQVGLADPEGRYACYPHQLSGGMQQRIMIALALACRPRLLVADEPTTALDVTVQAQILALLQRRQRDEGLSVLLITHNLGIVPGLASRVMVMYAGQIVESGPTEQVLGRPLHPYTKALLAAVPKLEDNVGSRLQGIEGTVPSPRAWPLGCRFHPRCPLAVECCRTSEPPWRVAEGNRALGCHLASW